MSRLSLFVLVSLFLLSLGTVAEAQCGCGPVYQSAPRSFTYSVDTSGATNPNMSLSSVLGAADYAGNAWKDQFNARGQTLTVGQGSGDVKIRPIPTTGTGVPGMGGMWDSPTKTIYIDEDVLTNPNVPVDYIKALVLHEMGHLQGMGQSPCAGTSVMSNTTLSSYRSVFTDCDKQALNSFFGRPQDDYCAGGCPDGYTSTCQGDQQPDECGCCVNYSPIVVHVGNGQIRMSDAANGVVFTINGNNSTLRVAWPESDGSGWLFLDRNGNGLVDNGSELFGNTTRLRSGLLAEHGYFALAELDDNGDARVDRFDHRFSELRLWFDQNRDGTSQPEELRSLEDVGVKALHTEATESDRTDQWGNRFKYRARVELRHGLRYSYDVFPVTVKLDGSATCSRPQSPATAK